MRPSLRRQIREVVERRGTTLVRELAQPHPGPRHRDRLDGDQPRDVDSPPIHGQQVGYRSSGPLAMRNSVSAEVSLPQRRQRGEQPAVVIGRRWQVELVEDRGHVLLGASSLTTSSRATAAWIRRPRCPSR